MTEQSSAPGGLAPTSIRSARVSAVRALSKRSARSESGTFLAEGPQAVREALAWGRTRGEILSLYATADALARHEFLAASATSVTVVEDAILAAMADTVTPQGVIAVCKLPREELASLFLRGTPRLVALLANVRDPGNVGTAIRSADAAGADGVIVSSESVDPWSPKAVRSSAGSLWHLPVVSDADLKSVIPELQRHGLQVLAAASDAALTLEEIEEQGRLATPTAWLFGNEAWGLPSATRDLADSAVSLPIFGHAESLNLSMAATIALYSSARVQRRA